MESLETGLGRGLFVLEDLDRFNQASDSGRAHSVTDVALHGADETRIALAYARLDQEPTERLDLDRVSHCGSGAVSLEIGDAGG